MTPELDRLLGSFLEANPLLPLALGALASIRRFDDVLEREAPAVPDPPSSEPSEALYVLLGLVKLRDVIASRLEQAVGVDAVPAALPVTHGPVWPGQESLLR